MVEEAQPAVSEEVQKKVIDLPSCKDNENLLRIRHSVSPLQSQRLTVNIEEWTASQGLQNSKSFAV